MTKSVPADKPAPGGPPATWTIKGVLEWTQEHFAQKGIDSPRLDAEVLLAHALGKNRMYLYTHYDQPLTPAERETYRALVQRRLRREPVAYILGEREFYGRRFVVNRDVLVPRPETEHLIDAVREWVDAHELKTPRMLDVGTGSGAIAVSLAAFYPSAHVTAIDVSAAALAVAQSNAQAHGVMVAWHEGDLLEPVLGQQYDVIAANLPYIATGERADLMPEVRDHEPGLALFGGDDGLALIRRLIARAPGQLASPGLLALEIGWTQAAAVAELLAGVGFQRVRKVLDLSGHERLVLAER